MDARSNTFRRVLLQRDAAAAARLVEAYGAVYARIQERVSELTREIESARSRGETIESSWLFQRDRLDSLSRQVDAEVSRFSSQANVFITGAQRDAVALAGQHASELVLAATRETNSIFPMFARLPSAAVENVVGFISPGAPFGRLLERLAGSAVVSVRQSIIHGVASGQTPRKVASEIRDALGNNLTQAMTISRTSMVNAYRTSTLQTYQANKDVISGWRWVCAKSTRTCLNCLARDGTIWPLEQPMPAHWNCRCTFVAVIEGQRQFQTGSEWFEGQSDQNKREMLGAQGFELYRRGEVRLSDFAGTRKDVHLGAVTYQRSLKEIRAGKSRAA